MAGIEKQVEAYRQALLIRKLEQHYVDRNLDTAFTAGEIAAYYNAHKSDYRLDRTLVRGRIAGKWVDFQEFLSHLPTLRTQNYDALLASTGVQEMHDRASRYYFQLEGVCRAGETAPLEQVRGTIRRILFNQRQGEIIRRHEEELYDRAVAEQEVQVPETEAEAGK